MPLYLREPYGGTGHSYYTDGALLIGNSTTLGFSVAAITTTGGATVTNGHGSITINAAGPGLSAPNPGTSGGIPYYNSTTTLASSALLTANRIVLGGGAGGAPSTPVGLGTTTTLLHGNAGGAPTFSAVDLVNDITNTLNVANGGTGLTSGISGGIAGFTATNTMSSSSVLSNGLVMVGGGAGNTPFTIANGQLPATATNDNAAAGKVGEYTSSVLLIASEVSLTTGTSANVTSISLTAGDWDVWGEVWFDSGATTTITISRCWVNTTSATLPTVPSDSTSVTIVDGAALNFNPHVPVAIARALLSGTTTYYLGTRTDFATSTLAAYGKICARRVR